MIYSKRERTRRNGEKYLLVQKLFDDFEGYGKGITLPASDPDTYQTLIEVAFMVDLEMNGFKEDDVKFSWATTYAPHLNVMLRVIQVLVRYSPPDADGNRLTCFRRYHFVLDGAL